MRWVALLAAVLVSACGGPGSRVEATAPAAEAAPVSIHTAAAEGRDVPTIVRATGTFVADESSEVTPSVPGQVIATPVNIGDMVNPGDVLVRLDDRDARLKLGQAQASLQQAEAQARRAATEAKRNADLVHEGLISPNSYEQFTTQLAVAEAAVAQAASQVAAAEKAVADAVIVAPFSGRHERPARCRRRVRDHGHQGGDHRPHRADQAQPARPRVCGCGASPGDGRVRNRERPSRTDICRNGVGVERRNRSRVARDVHRSEVFE